MLSFAQTSPAASPAEVGPADVEKFTPPQLKKLAQREREVASIIYDRGPCTANEVQTCLSVQISNGAVRSMLVRLVRKGILERRWGKRGRGHEYLYLPAIMPADVKQRALIELTENYFDGSLTAVAMGVLELINGELSK